MYAGVPITMPAPVIGVFSPLPRPASERARDAEVRHDRVSVGEQHVLRLDVAVHHFLAMGVVERRGDRSGNTERLVDGEAARAGDSIAQRLAAEIGHGEPEEAVALAGVVDREDVRMNQSGRDPDFLKKAAGQLAAGAHGGMQHFERDDPVMPEVARFVDRRHAAGADLLADLVLVGERSAEAGEEFRCEGHVGRSVGPSDSELLEMVIQVQHAHPAPVLPRHGPHGITVGPAPIERS